MYLKKISISGFKSFADRVNLTFDKGITGVIGPNGCGKSNVIDAVRWVMGEQSAKNLRGDTPTSIIFHGSEKRKSVGMAEVSIVFDNSTYDEFCPPEYRHEPQIDITRRIYNSGDREYFINKKPCRLKDVLAFFAATGTGGRSYSMIQQGQVERILNSKPEEIREIIEEAAGTLIYKTRRADTMKKLDNTNQNLLRVDDLIKELDSNQEKLKEQVTKAQQWKELHDKLRVEELSLYAHNYHFFQTQLSKATEEMAVDAGKEAETLANLATFEAREAELKTIMTEADPEMETLNGTITQIRLSITRAESSIHNANNRLDANVRRLENAQAEIAEDQENLREMEGQIEESAKEVDSADAKVRDLNRAIEGLNEQVEEVDEQAVVFQSRLMEFDDELKNFDRLIASNATAREGQKREMARIRREREDEERRVQAIEAEMPELRARVDAAQQKVDRQSAGRDREMRERESRQVTIAKAMEDKRVLTERRDTLRDAFITAKTKFDSLKELSAQAGTSESCRQIIAHDTGRGLVAGMLTDHITFTPEASELSARVRSAFEHWAERLVVNKLSDFNSLARLTQELKLSALPICVLECFDRFDAAKAREWAAANDAESFERYIRVGKGLPGLERLTERLYHLPVLQLTKDVLERLPQGVIAFTAQGIYFVGDQDFVIEGSTVKGLMTQREELAELERGIKSHQTELAACQADLDTIEARMKEDQAVSYEIEQKLNAENKEIGNLMAEASQVRQMLEHKEELIRQHKTRIGKFMADEARASDEYDGLERTRVAFEKERKGVDEERAGLKEEFDGLEGRREEIRRQFLRRREEISKYEERAQRLRQSYEQTRLQMENLQKKMSRRYDERSTIEQDNETCRVDLQTAESEIKRLVEQLDEANEAMAIKKESHSGLSEELRVIDSRLRELRGAQIAIQKANTTKTGAIERARMAIAGSMDQARERYSVELETYEFERDPNFDPDKRGRSVNYLRQKIEALGQVNMVALEEYQALQERQRFINQQRDDVLASIELLNTAIREIEETSRDRFMQIYNTVSVEFQKLFPILFQGGEAYLELSSKEPVPEGGQIDPLSAGVEILARLPGKKQQPMSLLSGGEKAFTAIALIFALLKTKPTPFCFLDEVDAPLDEANVGRFNKLLESLREQFQFIVITHNRRTMEVLDQLYGVTMQEPGVSTAVGVDMSKDLPAHLQKSFSKDGAPRAVEGASAT